ncbi:MAG: hypothetical protein Q4B26_07830 [Eubacteriales bacterium]|nr:hypothetical protein [Eubacteriales bacterium]
MKVLRFLLKLIIKVVMFPIVLVAMFLHWIASILINLSAYILSPVMLFVLGCAIYSVVKANWLNVGLLTGIEFGLLILMFGAQWVESVMEGICDGLVGFMYS